MNTLIPYYAYRRAALGQGNETLQSVSNFLTDVLEKCDVKEAKILVPSVDVIKDADTIIIKADLPGFTKDTISIEFKDDVLTICGERRQDDYSSEQSLLRAERKSGTYKRIIEMPYPVDRDKVTASFQDGVLEVKCGLQEEAKPKMIAIA